MMAAWLGGRRTWAWLLLFGAAVVSAHWFSTRVIRAHPKPGTSARVTTEAPVPVVAASAKVADLGIHLTGLGTVTALNTVTVRSRVDGELMDVAFREGQLVRKGDVLAHIDPRPFQVQLAQSEGQAAKDEAALKEARLELQRYRVLIDQDAIPRQQLDTQAAAVDQLVSVLRSDRAQIDSARLNLTYSRITAPISGRAGLRLVDRGNIVRATDQNGLVVLTQVQPIAVIFAIPQDAVPRVLAQVRAGRQLDVDVRSRDLNSTLATGTLLTVDNQIDPATGTVKLKAIVNNDDDALFPNQFVNARVLVDTIRQATTVPTASIQRGPQSTFVYVVTRESRVEIRNVTVGVTEGEVTSLSGVTPGDVVVTDGVDKLQPGTLVSVRRTDAGDAGAVAHE